MAITQIEYALVRRLKKEGLFPDNPALLELGQSNWYGDVPIDDFISDINRYVSDPARAREMVAMVKLLVSDKADDWLFRLADIFWETFLGQHTYEAIDLHGIDERAHKLDLNEPVSLTGQYDIVCNFGTAEHIFNVYQVFRTIHERTKPGGLMMHGLPFQGWVDHGFYNFQPTFVFDLAEANNYAPAVIMYAEVTPPRIEMVTGRNSVQDMAEKKDIGDNALIYTAFRKRSGMNSFKAPLQGYYARSLDKRSADRWKSLR